MTDIQKKIIIIAMLFWPTAPLVFAVVGWVHENADFFDDEHDPEFPLTREDLFHLSLFVAIGWGVLLTLNQLIAGYEYPIYYNLIPIGVAPIHFTTIWKSMDLLRWMLEEPE